MKLYSVRMHAVKDGRHASGAERIVPREKLESVLVELARRPKAFELMRITVEEVKELNRVPFTLKLSSYRFSSVKEARAFAAELLVREGVKKEVAEKAVRLLAEGPAPGGRVMRGAVLMDPVTGERLEEDPSRGVRTVRFDWSDREKARELILKAGGTERTVDALALAQKNLFCGVLAELCWSDDPSYVTGYVAGRSTGYARITPLKEKGDPKGGRVYFVKKEELERVRRCLEEAFLLVETPDTFPPLF
ncbi:MAG: 6-carboxyhexanoate--CoA ligase [Aquificae bacterium]|nr:6-carboxyhexanoate--CoA ligase [Aquificota bacterium]